MKQFAVDWRFCPECQCVQQRIYEDKPSHTGKISWVPCNHDLRPNSPKGVLENQAKELDSLHLVPVHPERRLVDAFNEVRTYQSPYEALSFVWLACRFLGNGLNIVEIGSFHGGTANLMANFLDVSMMVCIDQCFDYWMAPDPWQYARSAKIEAVSQSAETVKKLEQYFKPGDVDLLFIDGDHSFEGELADYNLYSPFVRDGGMIAFHDTHAIPDVGRIFQEVPGKAKFDLFSYQGIGVVIK